MVEINIIVIYNMYMTDIFFERLSGFDWDEGNRDKNSNKHGVSNWECEQLFFNEPLIILEDARHSASEQRMHALGRTDDDRELFIVFTVRNSLIRMISARDMHKKERKFYEQAKENSKV
jgi:uncharacterized protein